MSLLLVVLLVVLIFGAGGGYYAGGPVYGGGIVGVILLVILVLLLAGALVAVAAGDIEVGASAADGTLPLWLATQGVRNAELRLAQQISNQQAMEAKATSLLTWSSSVGVALAAAGRTGQVQWLPALVGVGVLSVCAFCSGAVLWPSGWVMAGHEWSRLTEDRGPNEIEVQEGIALGYDDGIKRNSARLYRGGWLLKRAWIALAAAPAAIMAAIAVATRFNL